MTNKSILLLEEQAIGDVMQFMTLLPDLLHECSDISILVNDRLYPTYFRHYSKSKYSKQLKIFKFSDIREGRVSSNDFDFNHPWALFVSIGLHTKSYGIHIPSITADAILSSKLRSKYFDLLGEKISAS